jgi:hypothetical protein
VVEACCPLWRRRGQHQTARVLDYIAENKWWPIGGIGLVLVSFAVTISGALPLVFNTFIAFGTGLVLVYNLLSFFLMGAHL